MPGLQTNVGDTVLHGYIYEAINLENHSLVMVGADFDLSEILVWADVVEALAEDQRQVLNFAGAPALAGNVSQIVCDPVTVTNETGDPITVYGWVVIRDDYNIEWAFKYDEPKVLVADGGSLSIQFIHNFDTKPL